MKSLVINVGWRKDFVGDACGKVLLGLLNPVGWR